MTLHQLTLKSLLSKIAIWSPERHCSIVGTDPCERGLAVDQLDPIAVRVVDEAEVAHVAVARLLLDLHTCSFHLFASTIQIIHEEPNVAEPLRLGIAIVDLEVLVLLCAMIP